MTYSYARSDEVLHELSATFSPGATVLLGANGAGKSTLLELLASVRTASSGSISLDGIGAPGPGVRALRYYRKSVAWLPQSLSAFPGLNVREHVAYAGWLKGMSKNAAWDESLRALDLVDLRGKATERVSRLSGGQQQRVRLAGAIVHDARVVLLDEPTAGLDPAQRRQFREVLGEMSANRVVLVSSHDTDDAHSVFEQVAVLREGIFTFHGSFADFVSASPQTGDMRDKVESAYLHWAGTEE